MQRRIGLVALIALGGAAAVGCDHDRHTHMGNTAPGMVIAANGIFGGANVNVNPGLCAGRVTLQQGEATVTDNCFSGETNVVVCTDATAPNPIKCAPGRGTLIVVGNGNDIISYARLR